jgi:NADPH:quinone reductase-like Zn-dependent oxidoreductase
MIESGKITPVVDKMVPLNEARKAYRDLETRHARVKIGVAL